MLKRDREALRGPVLYNRGSDTWAPRMPLRDATDSRATFSKRIDAAHTVKKCDAAGGSDTPSHTSVLIVHSKSVRV